MLRFQKRHISFHTPGHKRAGADITELTYSDNLLSPDGVIARAQEDVAQILKANRSFLLTDGSTCGVHAMLYALKRSGVRRIAYGVHSHKSVKEGCAMLGIEGLELDDLAFPYQPSVSELAHGIEVADALLLTSPNYYGFFPALQAAKDLCERAQKPLVIDGAHGSHLHFCTEHAGNYACMWVDGVHKSLPALTQGAVVSAKNEKWSELLAEVVGIFRTTSPSYPIMASVEYAIKYPRNVAIEEAALRLKREIKAYNNQDWSKILVDFGEYCDRAQTYLEQRGIYPEFNDGNFLMFYLSPCTTERHLMRLKKALIGLPRGAVQFREATILTHGDAIEAVFLEQSIGRICAKECGLFPPCIPLIRQGETITEEKIERLLQAKNTFGLSDGKISVYTEEI